MCDFILSPLSLDQLAKSIRDIVKSEIEANAMRDLSDKLMSPAETCKIFQPKISKVTLHSWTKAGRLQDHRIGGRVYYRYSEVLDAVKSLKKYKRD